MQTELELLNAIREKQTDLNALRNKKYCGKFYIANFNGRIDRLIYTLSVDHDLNLPRIRVVQFDLDSVNLGQRINIVKSSNSYLAKEFDALTPTSRLQSVDETLFMKHLNEWFDMVRNSLKKAIVDL